MNHENVLCVDILGDVFHGVILTLVARLVGLEP
jgi:hypothetical protein